MTTDLMQGLVQEAKKNKFSGIAGTFSDDDVYRIWENVSGFVQKQMQNQKGVHLPGFGTFAFVQKKLDVGGNKFVLLQRPVFTLAEKICQLHGVRQTKNPVTGSVPVVQLNYAFLSTETPFERDQVETCVREMFGAMNRSLAQQRTVELVFPGLGRLQVRENAVKFKFYKEFVNSLDSSGRVVQAMQNRPGTCDSVMSERPPTRPFSVSLPLPGIPEKTNGDVLATVAEEGDLETFEAPIISAEEPGIKRTTVPIAAATDLNADVLTVHSSARGHPFSLRPASDKAPPSPAEIVHPIPSGPDLADTDSLSAKLAAADAVLAGLSAGPADLSVSPLAPAPAAPAVAFAADSVAGGAPVLTPPQAPPSAAGSDARSALSAPSPSARSAPVLTPPRPPSSCGHPSSAGQELCYLCHQRSRRNVPVSFADELRRRELEEDRLLQAYQFMRDREKIINEQENMLAKRHDAQKIAAFNLGAGEATKDRKNHRDPNFYRSFIFQHRPLTPPKAIKQQDLSTELTRQVEHKENSRKKTQADENFLERLEQVQLAEDLAAQRDQFLREKEEQREMYRKALSAQVRHKPAPLPPREPDSQEPIFGRNDLSNEKLLERRRRAQEVFQEQVESVAQKKRDAILRRLEEQRHEEEVIQKTREDLLNDRASRFQRGFTNRRTLEENWERAATEKREREHTEKVRMSTPGELVHEQLDRYKRCHQCKRKTRNVGESNIWCDTVYIPGSRYIC